MQRIQIGCVVVVGVWGKVWIYVFIDLLILKLKGTGVDVNTSSSRADYSYSCHIKKVSAIIRTF